MTQERGQGGPSLGRPEELKAEAAEGTLEGQQNRVSVSGLRVLLTVWRGLRQGKGGIHGHPQDGTRYFITVPTPLISERQLSRLTACYG